MTFGIQVGEEQTHQILDKAIKEMDINFLDTAEMYPVPSTDPNWVPGRSEEYIASWLAKNPGMREKIVIATKVSGFSPQSETAANREMRSTPPTKEEGIPSRLDKESILKACDASLRRLQTDYIDVYQVHWPDRYQNIFGSVHFNPELQRDGDVPIEETVAAMGELIKAGKIKYWGLGNDNTFGVCQAINACDKLNVPRPISIQNHYSFLDRRFELELVEACDTRNYNISLLPWSVLCGGALTGKYIGGKAPEGSRGKLYPFFMGRFFTKSSQQAIPELMQIAEENGMSMTTLMLAWYNSKKFIGSTIIGVTTMAQLEECRGAFDVELDKSVRDAVERTWAKYPNCVFSVGG
eukprot:CAMPEP_0113963946 /NCGR_PEP_ID=MMETSP0011_2-20120614/6824_1 /TAXON_ID=101924 /ORGANISM="Rhodosorus marinus" /LENGTH=351 /DNA_ID=CAMNT_0000976109 /DNA_START=150 /DNA_END=1205 /DNA_ORIENTATION=+ /assembly_acc=CAM_ASM_000156